MDTQAFQDEPLVLKIVYMGTTGGIASFREVWSRQGRIVHTADHAFDPGATNLRIAGIDVAIIAMDSSSVTSHAKAPAPRLAWNTYWSTQFER